MATENGSKHLNRTPITNSEWMQTILIKYLDDNLSLTPTNYSYVL